MIEINGTVIAVIFNFLLLVWILNKLLYKPIQDMLLARKKLVEDNIKFSQQELLRANELKMNYEKQISNAQSEVQEIVKNATSTAENMKTDILNSARKDAEIMQNQAKNEAENLKRMALGSAKNQLASLIYTVSGKYIKQNMDENSQKGLIDEMINKVEGVNLS